MADYFFILGYNKTITSHRDTNNTYMLQMAILPDKHPDFSLQEAQPSAAIQNFRRIINRLKERPEIESITIVPDYSSFSETGSFSSTDYRNTEDTTKIAEAQFVRFITGEDYLKVFRHTTNNGQKLASVNDYNWNDPANVLITRMLEKQLFAGQSAIGKTIERTYKDPAAPRDQYRVIGILDDVKRFDYLRPYGMVFRTEQLDESNFYYCVIGFRTKGNIPASKYIPDFKKEMSSTLKIGNYYLAGLTSFTQLIEETDYRTGITNDIRLRSSLMIFFLINITLCVLGVFWYRVNIRREEIGIRRAMGSDAAGIRKLFIIEGLILLTIVVPLAMIIETQFIANGLIDTLGRDPKSYGNYLPDHTIVRFLITNLITWMLLAVMMIFAIWYPARTASRITPVEALRDE